MMAATAMLALGVHGYNGNYDGTNAMRSAQAEAVVAAEAVAADPATDAAVPHHISNNATATTMTTADVVNDSPGEEETKMTASEFHLEEATRRAKMHSGQLKIFSGNGNMSLAQEICRNLGVNLGKAIVGRFADGEVQVEIQENVRTNKVLFRCVMLLFVRGWRYRLDYANISS
jgi:hypothetical protein